jgi:thiamine biosynthesis lipoprotein
MGRAVNSNDKIGKRRNLMRITNKFDCKKYIKPLSCLLLAATLLCGCSRASDSKSVSASGFYFDTIITITLYGTEDQSPIDACFSLASHYEDLFSTTISDSEVSQINANAGSDTYVTVSDETLDLINAGIAYGKLSDGCFDITIGKLSSLWDFSDIAENLDTPDNEADASLLPDPEEISRLCSHVNYENIRIDGNNVLLTDPDAAIDLGGIAKGYIADRMREYLNEQGYHTGIINLGGNILTLGSKKSNSDYSIGIQMPFGESGEVIGVVGLPDGSVVTSGVYERYFTVDGKRYHHILDVNTGYPCDNNLYEVTIISTSSMDGDALSTTCFVLGLEKGLQLIESLDETEAVFVTSDYEIYTTSGIGDTITFTAE